MRHFVSPPLRQLVVSATARWAFSALLCLSAQFASYDAWASPPGGERFVQGCVLEGFLLGPTGGYLSLPYRDQVDWTKFEGQMIRFKKRFGLGIDVLVIPPSATGPCDAALVAAALPRALAQRADNESVRQNEHEKGLADIERAIKLSPQNCDFVATHVFILERLGRRKEANSEAARAAHMTCSQLYRAHLRWLRQGIVVQLY